MSTTGSLDGIVRTVKVADGTENPKSHIADGSMIVL
jgi:hypothetical protein